MLEQNNCNENQFVNKAIKFIEYDQKTQKFFMTEESEKWLSNLNDDKLGVISIVGKYRTGKSFFINRVLLNKVNDGFGVGPTINPCTKGIQLWTQTFNLNTKDDDGKITKAIIIDTEGFGGMEEGQNHDSRIFLFSLLLSSYFIYNSVGNIDENSLSSLSLIINLAKEIQAQQSQNSTDDNFHYFPSFLWIIRDFALQLIDGNNNQISSKQYLENSLEEQKGISDTIEQKNRLRKHIKRFFAERDCATLVRPCESEKDLQNLHQMTNEQLRQCYFNILYNIEKRPEFIEQMMRVRTKILNKVKPKKINSKSLTGSQLVSICKAYIEAVNNGTVPNVESAWHYLCKNEAYKQIQNLHAQFKQYLEDKQNQQNEFQFLLQNQMFEIKNESYKRIIQNLHENMKGFEINLPEIEYKLKEKLRKTFKNFKQKNQNKIIEYFTEIIQPQIQEIEFKVKEGQYKQYEHFFFDIKQEIKEKFFKNIQQDLAFSVETQAFANKQILKLIEFSIPYIFKQQNDKFSFIELSLNKKVEMLEQDLKSQNVYLSNEITKQQEKFKLSESQLIQFKVSNESLQKQFAIIEKDYEQRINEQQLQIKMQQEDYQVELKKLQDLIIELKNINHQEQQKLNYTILQKEKQIALLEQASVFSKQEYQRAIEDCQKIIQVKEKLEAKLISMEEQLQLYKNQIKEKEERHSMSKDEQNQLIKQYNEKLSNLNKETEIKQNTLKANFDLQRVQYEKEIEFYKQKQDETKNLYTQLLETIQKNNDELELKQKNQKHEDIDSMQTTCKQLTQQNSELVCTNNNLSAALDKMEQRCTLLQNKLSKAKENKTLLNNVLAVQCIHCRKLITTAIFQSHLHKCMNFQEQIQLKLDNSQKLNSYEKYRQLNQQQASNFNSKNQNYNSTMNIFYNELSNLNETMEQMQRRTSQQFNTSSNFNTTQSNFSQSQSQYFKETQPKFNQMDQFDKNPQLKDNNEDIFNNNFFHIFINQTMVKETTDNKPYTEYMIQLCLKDDKQVSWSVPRKYKEFCELHNQLQKEIPHIKFPQSSASIIVSSSNMEQLLNNNKKKRTPVIDERRKCLQQFLRDIAEIKEFRSHPLFQKFIAIPQEIIQHYRTKILSDIEDKNSTKQQQVQSKNQKNLQDEVLQSINDGQQNNKIEKNQEFVLQSPNTFLKSYQYKKGIKQNSNAENISESQIILKNLKKKYSKQIQTKEQEKNYEQYQRRQENQILQNLQQNMRDIKQLRSGCKVKLSSTTNEIADFSCEQILRHIPENKYNMLKSKESDILLNK